MIHINSNKGRGTNMFNRRPRNYLHIGFIILLMLGVFYLLYVNNIAHGQINTLEDKTQRYHSQHQSLSSQLQVVYEDRSRLENTLHKTKNEHQAVKDELQLQKETHENIVQDMILNHKEKYEELENEHQDTKEQLAKLMGEIDETRRDRDSLEEEKQKHLDMIDSHQIEKEKLVKENNDLRALFNKSLSPEQYNDVSSQHQNAQQMQASYASRLQQSQNLLNDYEKLKEIMRKAGADVIKLDHEQFDELSQEERMLLFSHFGGSESHGPVLEQRRVQLKSDALNREEAIKRQQEQRSHRDRQVAEINEADVKQNEVKNQPGVQSHQKSTSVCMLPLDAGTCTGRIMSYHFHPVTSSCQTFYYTGCGGNDNRFSSLKECEAKCIGLQVGGQIQPQAGQMPNPHNLKPPGEDGAAQNRYNFESHDNQGRIDAADQEGKSPAGLGNGPAPQKLNKPVIQSVRSDGDVERPVLEDNFNKKKTHDDDAQQLDPPQDPVVDADNNQQDFNESENPIEREEARVKDEERRAKEELDAINRQQEDDQHLDNDSEVVDRHEAIKKLGQINEKQREFAEQQAKNFEQLAAIKAEKGKMHGRIEDEEEEEEEHPGLQELHPGLEQHPGQEEEDEPVNQMLLPPAVQRVDNEQQMPVLDAPNLNEKERRVNVNEETFENEDYGNGGELEEEEEEEEEGGDNYNETIDDNRDDYDGEEQEVDADDRDAAARNKIM